METLQLAIRFSKGQYKGRLVSDILISDPDYVKWSIKNNLISLPKMSKV